MISDRDLYLALQEEGSDQQRAAFESLYEELYAIALFMLQNSSFPAPRELAQDCTQEAVVKIWQHLATCEQPDTFRNWAKRILRNHTLNEITRLKRRREESLEHQATDAVTDPHPTPQATFGKLERYNTILDLIAAAPLSDRSRYVILAKYLLQMSEEEIAQGVSAREGAAVLPSHVQVNFKKIYSDPDLLQQFADLQEPPSTDS
jgi:RNA polymerase sigma factor (sigma-70 family)